MFFARIVASFLLLFSYGSATPSTKVTRRDVSTILLAPTPTQTSTAATSINWWPYPPMNVGLVTSSLISNSNAALVTTPAPVLNVATTSPTSGVLTATTSYIDIDALPPDAVASPRPATSVKSSFNPMNLVPVFAVIGFFVGSLFIWLCFRCNSRVQRSAISDQLEPGPPYVPIANYPEIDEQGSPSKHSTHGSAYPDGNRFITRTSSFRTRHSAISPSSHTFSWPAPTVDGCEDDPFLVAPSKAAPTPGRVTADFMSPDPLSLLCYDERDEIAPYESLNHKSIRAGILDKLRLATTRKKGEFRTRNGHVRMNSDCQAVGGDRWGLGWMKEKKNEVDTYTVLPSRVSAGLAASSSPTGVRVVDSTILPTSPTVLSSAKLHSELFFSPPGSVMKTPEKKRRKKTLKKEKTLPPLPPCSPPTENVVSIRPSSSYYLGSSPPKRSAAERHIARQSALNKVEEIVSKSRSEKGLSLPQSPTLFGAISVGVGAKQQGEGFYEREEIGIEQRLFG